MLEKLIYTYKTFKLLTMTINQNCTNLARKCTIHSHGFHTFCHFESVWFFPNYWLDHSNKLFLVHQKAYLPSKQMIKWRNSDRGFSQLPPIAFPTYSAVNNCWAAKIRTNGIPKIERGKGQPLLSKPLVQATIEFQIATCFIQIWAKLVSMWCEMGGSP